jgi:two-component system cell cycle sensor histidine kinase/response regulator CckA
MEALGQLAGGIAHDFNNQLSGIMGHADLLALELMDDPLSEHAEVIIRACRAAADLNKKLLSFSRARRERSVAVDLHQVIEDVVALLRRSISKQITVHTLLRAQKPILLGDPAALQNALLNIAINARDAMQDGGTLTFATERLWLDSSQAGVLDPGAYLQVTVADTGVGMDEATLQRAFEPFYTTKPEGKGTGMGLASVYSSIKSHNGSVHIQSTPGKGTVVEIRLPSVRATGDDFASSETEQRQLGNGRVLLVDDERVVRTTVARMLQSLGYRVSTAATGTQAIEMVEADEVPYDLLIVDLMMPGMSGQQTINELKMRLPEAKVLVASGFSTQDVRNADEILHKPFAIGALSRAVATLLNAEKVFTS